MNVVRQTARRVHFLALLSLAGSILGTLPKQAGSSDFGLR
jgi:hypothetical protein